MKTMEAIQDALFNNVKNQMRQNSSIENQWCVGLGNLKTLREVYSKDLQNLNSSGALGRMDPQILNTAYKYNIYSTQYTIEPLRKLLDDVINIIDIIINTIYNASEQDIHTDIGGSEYAIVQYNAFENAKCVIDQNHDSVDLQGLDVNYDVYQSA